ncbi:spore germination protein [Brassicibacter mesophilus]|uniref:spore germination protein n=1 Tax=Brassicibacter mesophilus TaxID=745119 RepID=UPI003D259988
MRNIKQNKFLKRIEDLRQDKLGITIRKISIIDIEIFLLYIPQLTDRERLSSDIIKPILQFGKNEKLDIDTMVSSILYLDDICIDDEEDSITEYILKGNTVILTSNDDKYIIANTFKVEKRSVEPPDIQTAIRAPRDSFTENLNTNLSLIRYRIKDSALRIDYCSVGRRTKTTTAVIYIDDIANPRTVSEIKNRLKDIKIDGIVESGYIQKFILNNPLNLFPQVSIAERSDTACASILNGKICVIVEGSNLALILPTTFFEFLDTGDDHYDNLYLAVFTKFIRITAIIITLNLSALYVAVVSFHPDILPPQYILALATSRVTVPVNALLEATLMEFVSELLREASIRLPKQIGPAIGIVGTIVIGQAAVAAGLVSPLMVIIVSLSTMASFAAPDYTITTPIRILKFMMIFITGVFGLFGFIMGFTIIVINIVSATSFGVPYFSPVAPLNVKDLKNYILSDITLAKIRPRFLKTKDKTKQ